jgi:hypothetical protein
MILGWSPFKIVFVSTVLYPSVKKLIIMLIQFQFGHFLAQNRAVFGHLKKFLFLVTAAIFNGGRANLNQTLLK